MQNIVKFIVLEGRTGTKMWKMQLINFHSTYWRTFSNESYPSIEKAASQVVSSLSLELFKQKPDIWLSFGDCVHAVRSEIMWPLRSFQTLLCISRYLIKKIVGHAHSDAEIPSVVKFIKTVSWRYHCDGVKIYLYFLEPSRYKLAWNSEMNQCLAC